MDDSTTYRTASDVVTVYEAKERLRLGLNQTYQALHDGKIPGAFQLGRRWIIPRLAFERLLRGDSA
jgi:excisionase family DNA binding protein